MLSPLRLCITCWVLVCVASFAMLPPINAHSKPTSSNMQDCLRQVRTKRSSVNTASVLAKQYQAWKKFLRKAKIAGMKHTDLKSRQTFYVKNGGYLQAIRDFDSAKPDDVRSFKGTNMVFGKVGTFGRRTIVLQGKIEKGIPSRATLRVFDTEDMHHPNAFADIITYVEPL